MLPRGEGGARSAAEKEKGLYDAEGESLGCADWGGVNVKVGVKVVERALDFGLAVRGVEFV